MAKSPLISIRKIGEASIVWLSTQKLHGQIVPLRGRIFGQLNCTWSVGSCDSQWQIVWSNCWIIAESFYVNDWLIWLLFLATWSTCRLQMASAHSCSSWGLQPIWLWNAMKLERLHTSSHVMSCHVMSCHVRKFVGAKNIYKLQPWSFLQTAYLSILGELCTGPSNISKSSAVIHAHGCCFDPSTCPGGFRRLKPTKEVLHNGISSSQAS